MAATVITLRIPPAMLDEIDQTAAELGMSRTELLIGRIRWAQTMEKVSYGDGEKRRDPARSL